MPHICALRVIAAGLIAIVWATHNADACSCSPAECGDVTKADAVFIATVDRIVSVFQMDGRTMIGRDVHLSDIRGLRGEPERVLRVGSGYAGNCSYEFRRGERYLIVAYRRPQDGRLDASICSLTRPLADAKGLIDYIESLDVPADGARVWGRVEVGTRYIDINSPLRGAKVTIRGQVERTTTSDAEGNYDFTRLPPGRYTVAATLPPERKGFIPIPAKEIAVELARGCAIVDFFAKNDGRIRGRVIGPGGAPIPNLLVELQPLPYRRQPGEYRAPTDAEGRYEFPDVSEGRYRVGINFLAGPNVRQPYAITSAKSINGDDFVDVSPGEHVTLSPLTLTPLSPVTVDIVVQLEGGSPVSDVGVEAYAVGSIGPFMAAEATKPIAPGHFQMQLFRDTPYRFRVRRALTTLRTVDMNAGGTFFVITVPK